MDLVNLYSLLQGATAMAGGVQFVRGRDFKTWEVARASSAAPTFFPGKLRTTAL